jgi:hypothetical protein
MRTRIAVAALSLGALMALPDEARASSHREAPFITKNPKVDGTDFYMFKSYQTVPDRKAFVTLIANYLPLQDPNGGPNYFTLDSEALYEIHIDNTGDAKEDITFQFRFQNALANGGNGLTLDVGTGAAKKTVAVSFVNLGSPDTAALNVMETYSVKVVRGDRRTGMAKDVMNASGGATTFKKPTDYIGTKSYGAPPAYATYADKFVYDVNIPDCATPARMFVGQRHESFAVNLGPIFDLVNAPAAVITGGTTRAARNLVPNPLDGKNITSIALEVPISCLTTGTGGTKDIIGGWTTASVRQARVINPTATYTVPSKEGGAWTQVSRLGMPLVNEVVVGIKDKDKWNSSSPKDDGQFADYVTNPTLPAIVDILFGPGLAPTVFPRVDLIQAFLTGVPNVNANGSTAEMVRLNTALPATAKGAQNSLGAAACFVNGVLTLANPGCDPAGFPNGRRPGDDVTDITLRVAMGYLFANDTQAPARNVAFTDAVLQEDSQFDDKFPYVTTPNPGAM